MDMHEIGFCQQLICELQPISDDESPTSARPNTTKSRPKLQSQNSRTGSGGASRPHTGYGKTRTTEGMANGSGKLFLIYFSHKLFSI